MKNWMLGGMFTASCIAIAANPVAAQTIPGVPLGGDQVEQVQEESSTEEAFVEPDAQNEAGGNEIVVRGLKQRMSSWKRAEGENTIVYSNGSEKQLSKLVQEIDRLDDLLSIAFNAPEPEAEHVKLTIVLIGNGGFVERMRLHTDLVQASGYSKPYATERFYLPGENRLLLVGARRDQKIELEGRWDDYDPFAAFDDDADYLNPGFDDGFFDDPSYDSPGGTSVSSQLRNIGRSSFSSPASGSRAIPPVRREWETVLFGAYAEHFLLTNFPASYPRWYLDGINSLFSTFDVKKGGEIEYGRSPSNLFRVLQDYPPLDIEPILDGSHLAEPDGGVWSPYHAWLLAHYFIIGQPTIERRAELLMYLQDAVVGRPLSEAAERFTDLRALSVEVDQYRRGKIFYNKVNLPGVAKEPDISRFNEADAKALQAMVRLDSRVASVPEEISSNPKRAEKSMSRLGDYIEELAELSSQKGATTQSLLLEAEAACRIENYSHCETAAGIVLKFDQNNSDALAWKGRALLGQSNGDAELVKAARESIVAANRADTEARLPLVSYFRSFSDIGEPVPEVAEWGLRKVIAQMPTAPEPRILLARELIREGQVEMAREVLLPALNAEFGSAARNEAEQMLGGV